MRYLYHGSPAKDKESILREGLKCQDPKYRCVCLSYSASDAWDFVTGVVWRIDASKLDPSLLDEVRCYHEPTQTFDDMPEARYCDDIPRDAIELFLDEGSPRPQEEPYESYEPIVKWVEDFR